MINDKTWGEYLEATKNFSRHYAATEPQQRKMCEIVSELDNPVVVELGICNGLTGALLLLAGKDKNIEYHGVDNFSLENTYEEVRGKFDELKVPCEIHLANTHDLPWDKPIDFLFIDGGHDEANVRPDCEKWIPFVKPGGYVAFHDYDGCADASQTPHWAVTVFGDAATKGWTDVAYIEDQLMIRQRPL